jgi:hypothetical protein
MLISYLKFDDCTHQKSCRWCSHTLMSFETSAFILVTIRPSFPLAVTVAKPNLLTSSASGQDKPLSSSRLSITITYIPPIVDCMQWLIYKIHGCFGIQVLHTHTHLKLNIRCILKYSYQWRCTQGKGSIISSAKHVSQFLQVPSFFNTN